MGYRIATLRLMKQRMMPIVWMGLGALLGIVLTCLFAWYFALKHIDASLGQAVTIAAILRRAEQDHQSADYIIHRLEAEGYQFEVESLDNRKIIVLADEVNFLGMGGRWIIHLQLDHDGKVLNAAMESQPVGWP